MIMNDNIYEESNYNQNENENKILNENQNENFLNENADQIPEEHGNAIISHCENLKSVDNSNVNNNISIQENVTDKLTQDQNQNPIEKTIPSLIIDKLYLGNSKDAEDKEMLQSLGIKNILVIGVELNFKFTEDFEYKKISVFDCAGEDIGKYFEESIEFIKDGINKGGCLVHCAVGKSRSPTIIISYLMKEKNVNFLDAYSFVKTKRGIVKPNIGFLDQLSIYEEYLNMNKPKEDLKLCDDSSSYYSDYSDYSDCWVEI